MRSSACPLQGPRDSRSRLSLDRDYSHRSLLDKLGVKPGMRVSVLGVRDEAFIAQLERAGADVSTRRRQNTDLFVVGIEEIAAMKDLRLLEPFMLRNGGIWVVYPKGRKDLRATDVIGLGVKAGFIDNKGCAFSETHTALRFVIPKARR